MAAMSSTPALAESKTYVFEDVKEEKKVISDEKLFVRLKKAIGEKSPLEVQTIKDVQTIMSDKDSRLPKYILELTDEKKTQTGTEGLSTLDMFCLKLKDMLIEIIKRGDVEALRELCFHGMNKSDITETVLNMAVTSGHVTIVEEFRLNWGLTLTNLRTNNNATLILAFDNCDISMIKELKKWGLTKDDMKVMNNCTFRLAAARGYVSFLKELRLEWGFTRADVVKHATTALYNAIEFNRVLVLKEFRDNWGLTRADIKSGVCIKMAESAGHTEVLEELRLHW